ncbi:DMT family transporter [Nocardioides panacis]|uniref:DMT family transporter n=1 Tax=Nocardioides panacis TaxID=2849501 RepID=A0A975SXG5_9ACTN|nr:EamA family transporter [Nocardioides panacis]QWZ07739.1 DMT family transporter [Nocardioides panacis]
MLSIATAAPASVGVAVTGAVLAAAVLHAVWNALAHAIGDQLVGFALIGTAVTAGAVVLVLVAPAPARACWPFLAGSAAMHVVYNLLLMRCYRLGEFGQVYPLARGTSPWLVAFGAAVLVHEELSVLRLVGVVTISVGLGLLVFVGGVPTRAARPAIAAAVLTGVAIATYTTLDGVGVRSAGTVAGYTGWLFLLQGPVLPVAALVVRRGRLPRQLRPHLRAGLAGGALSMAAYALVLWAQTRGALAPIAALRESSVIVGAVIGAVVFGERFGRWRIAATVLVATGVVLVTV